MFVNGQTNPLPLTPPPLPFLTNKKHTPIRVFLTNALPLILWLFPHQFFPIFSPFFSPQGKFPYKFSTLRYPQLEFQVLAGIRVKVFYYSPQLNQLNQLNQLK